MSPSSKTWVPGSSCNHTVDLKRDSKTALQFTEIKIYSNCHKNSPPQKSHERDVLKKHLQIDQSIFPSYGTHTTNYFHCWVFLCIRDLNIILYIYIMIIILHYSFTTLFLSAGGSGVRVFLTAHGVNTIQILMWRPVEMVHYRSGILKTQR